MSDLTEKQEAFLAALFGEAKGNVRKAMTIAGYSEGTQSYPILKALSDEIVERSKVYLASHAAQATMAGLDIFNDPTALGSDRILALSKEVWDRSGIVKKDGLSGLGGPAIGVLILPAKDAE